MTRKKKEIDFLYYLKDKEEVSGKKIESLFVYVIIDEDGDEGVPAFKSPAGVWMPLFGADEARITSLKNLAAQIAAAHNKEVRLLKFEGPPILVETILPVDAPDEDTDDRSDQRVH